jgi:hypothetical protein
VKLTLRRAIDAVHITPHTYEKWVSCPINSGRRLTAATIIFGLIVAVGKAKKPAHFGLTFSGNWSGGSI